ncbi:Coiled-coil and C2 domain-containing protein 2A [Cichlidogyrus casuarinus]|uniref:Coiled-coil and C2 domain-containing protein 2A n=1 Tax=Cichlidogyrus casuarinus TaxID=1844966 RepID=A0ABD2QC65_9PLAT
MTRKLDPNNPDEAKLVELMKIAQRDGAEPYNKMRLDKETVPVFRLNHLLEKYEFCSMEDLEENRRLRMLQLRDWGVSEFRGLVVPAMSREIPRDAFKAYEARIGISGAEKVSTKSLLSSMGAASEVKGLQALKRNHEMYIAKLRARVMECFQKAIKRKTLSQMVIEEKIPTIISLIPMLLALSEARRPLRPTKKERKQVALDNIRETGLEILITVRSAYNLPTRKIVSKDQQALAASAFRQGVATATLPAGATVDFSGTLTGQLATATKAIMDLRSRLNLNRVDETRSNAFLPNSRVQVK